MPSRSSNVPLLRSFLSFLEKRLKTPERFLPAFSSAVSEASLPLLVRLLFRLSLSDNDAESPAMTVELALASLLARSRWIWEGRNPLLLERLLRVMPVEVGRPLAS